MKRLFQRYLRPSFLIIGVEKGGTTSFFHHLALHPRILAPREKEVCYFNKDALFSRGPEWYHRQFPRAAIWSGKTSFEASPAYFYYPGVAERIAEFDPGMKLIVMLRDPVERAYSAWNMHRQLRERSWDVVNQRLSTQPESVRASMLQYYELVGSSDFTATAKHLLERIEYDEVEPGLLKRGLYARQLAEYRRHFPAEQLLILESARCGQTLSGELDRVADFLNLDRVKWGELPVSAEMNHRRTYAEPMPEDARSLLRDFYRQPNEELFAMIGERYEWSK